MNQGAPSTTENQNWHSQCSNVRVQVPGGNVLHPPPFPPAPPHYNVLENKPHPFGVPNNNARLPFPGNQNLLDSSFPVKNGNIIPTHILNSSSNKFMRPTFPGLPPVRIPAVGISSFPARPVQMNLENKPINADYIRPMHEYINMASNPKNIPSVAPLQPNVKIEEDVSTDQTFQLRARAGQNMHDASTNRTMRFPPPNFISTGHCQPRLAMNMDQSFRPPVFVPIHQVRMLNNVVETPAFPPQMTSQSNEVSEFKNLKAEYKETMNNIVKEWILSRNSFTLLASKNKQFMKIHRFKEKLKNFVGLIEKLRCLNDSLVEQIAAEKHVWDSLVENVEKNKNELIKLQYQLFNPEQMQHITVEQRKRKKKRDRIRRKKKVLSETYVSSLTKRIKLNEVIDEALQKQRTIIAMEKRNESLKNAAGESLVEVKRKQTEVIQFIDVFNLLKELREIRKKTAIYQGIFVTEKDDEKFSSQIKLASKLLSENAKVYESEEYALRELREEEAQEMNRIEKEKRKIRKESRQEQLTQVDPMFPYRLYWLQGEESVAGLIHVRRMWDIFVCPPGTHGGTRIPKYFVEPCKPCNKEWEKYMVKQPKVRKRKSDYGTATPNLSRTSHNHINH